MDIEVELSRIIINESTDEQIIVLKEREGERIDDVRRASGIDVFRAQNPLGGDLIGHIERQIRQHPVRQGPQSDH